ncbi:LytR/AlgR family response regulator transcription factor [Runella slithyformis]|uniref:Response regulator receiver protein n=1 Tax=Runella slithyformis (strain ATCC 29530 / DSM 19594 / LMG 11500 / NCIMB 11436 / LSU 4) TaxID=761193 RepID=A0A7U3ZLZ2_RUNSL|nr:LytTR family DNA-binding domain-containing protein [Runella slithyformis]AEI49656.1 response regulator receiver protein [Runella slithyformis DSM 19594]
MSSFLQSIPFESAVQLPRFQTKNGEQTIDLRRILYLSAQGNYTRFHLDDGEQVITSHSLSIYARLLEKHGFVRVHKSHLLNLEFLRHCRIQRSQWLVLPDRQTLEIARRRRAKLKKTMAAL